MLCLSFASATGTGAAADASSLPFPSFHFLTVPFPSFLSFPFPSFPSHCAGHGCSHGSGGTILWSAALSRPHRGVGGGHWPCRPAPSLLTALEL